MKVLFKFIFVSLLATSFNMHALGKSIPSYYVAFSKKDSNLKSTEALFEIRFSGIETQLDYTKDFNISCNGVIIKGTVDSTGSMRFPVSPGKYKFQFFYNTLHEEIITDSIDIASGFKTRINVQFKFAEFRPVEAEKPVIYLYPSTPTQVQIQLSPNGPLGFTYPKYDNGWSVMANKDGKLEVNGKTHNYLFWDGQLNINPSSINLQEGFVIESNNLVSFFEEKLTIMGLNASEQEDFITYWAPQMISHNKCFIRFMFNDEYNEYASMQIDPKPDHLFRVFMLWAPSSSIAITDAMELIPQEIESVQRDEKSFTVIEWGGANINNLLNKQYKIASSTH